MRYFLFCWRLLNIIIIDYELWGTSSTKLEVQINLILQQIMKCAIGTYSIQNNWKCLSKIGNCNLSKINWTNSQHNFPSLRLSVCLLFELRVSYRKFNAWTYFVLLKYNAVTEYDKTKKKNHILNKWFTGTW